MLLKTKDHLSSVAGSVTVKRDPDTRRLWVDYYADGNRRCHVSFRDKCCHALMTKAPVVSGGSITFSFSLISIAEVWGGLDGRLASVFVNVNGETFHGEAISGWKFKPTELKVNYPYGFPSEQAEDLALTFVDNLINQAKQQDKENEPDTKTT